MGLTQINLGQSLLLVCSVDLKEAGIYKFNSFIFVLSLFAADNTDNVVDNVKIM